VANGDDLNVSVLLGNGSGGLGAATNFAVGNVPSSVATGDFDRDGQLDLAVVIKVADDVTVLLGDGAGGFGAPTIVDVGDGPLSATTGDFNRGKPDPAVANVSSDNISVLRGRYWRIRSGNRLRRGRLSNSVSSGTSTPTARLTWRSRTPLRTTCRCCWEWIRRIQRTHKLQRRRRPQLGDHRRFQS
jgi:hypothetical protein